MVNNGICATSSLIKMSDKSQLGLEDCVLRNNFNNYSANAQNVGGAIFLGGQAKATLSNTTIRDCYSYTFGSAVYMRDNSSLIIESGVFSGNSGTTKNNTSVFCVDNSSTCLVNGGTFENNLANLKGGVFWVSNGKLDIDGGKFRNNYAVVGSSIYLNGSAKVNIADFEEIEEVYLPRDKKIYIAGLLLNKTLNVKMEDTSNDTIVAICEDDELIYKVLKSIKVTDKLLYVDGNNIKIGEKTSAKAVIKNGEKEIYFSNLFQAINCADSGDKIILKDDVVLSEDIYIEKSLIIDLSNFQFVGVQYIKTQTLCKVFADNLIKIRNHLYNQEITYTWSEDNSTCTAIGYCECGGKHTESVQTNTITHQTNEDKKILIYTAEFTYEKFVKQEKNVTLDSVNNSQDWKKKNAVLILSIGVGGIVLIVLGVLLFSKLKKKKKSNNKRV